VHASIIDMTLRLPVDAVLFDELRSDFLPRAAQHPGFRGFQYVLAEQGRAIGILWYEQPEDLDGIAQSGRQLVSGPHRAAPDETRDRRPGPRRRQDDPPRTPKT
jgi:hypothetical protein